MRAALYARYSTNRQSEASIADQFRECLKLAKHLGATVIARFEDKGISGGTTERPGYQLLLTMARAKQFDIIIADDTSRLWRNMAEQAPRLAELQDLGIHVVTHDLDSRHESAELTGAVMGAMNTMYRKEISRRTKRGLEGLALAGKSTGGYPTYGYAEGQGEVVRRIFKYRAAGASLADICRALNWDQVPAPRGGQWGRSSVRAILTNVRYTGKVLWGQTEIRGGASDSRRRRRVEREGGPVIDRFDPNLQLINQEMFDTVNGMSHSPVIEPVL